MQNKHAYACLLCFFALSELLSTEEPSLLDLPEARDSWQEEGIWGVSLHVRSQPMGLYTDTIYIPIFLSEKR